MKRKIIAAVAALARLLILTVVLIMINHPVNTEDTQPAESTAVSDVQEISEQSSEFDFVCTDRLCGCPETDRHTTSDSIEVVFFDIGTIRKEYGSEAVSEEDKFGESTEKVINGMNVTFKGENGRIQLASWSDNGFTYTIRINSSDDAVNPEEMTDYIMATR